MPMYPPSPPRSSQGIGRTYRYYNASAPGAEPVLYGFGYGLSYTNFSLAWDTPDGQPPALPPVTSTDGSTSFPVIVRNIGNADGDEVVQVRADDLCSPA